jgi:hypothetical protein
MIDPLLDFPPTLERLHPRPSHAPPCPACRAPLLFTHHDAPRGTVFWPMGVAFYWFEFVAIAALIAAVATVATWAGIVPALVVVVLAAPFVHRWTNRKIQTRAVWRCAPCDAFYVGEPPRPWKAP